MIDLSKLPWRALVDTMVLRFGLDEKSKSEHAPLCRAFLDAMEKAGRPIYVAAPSLAEWHRYAAPKPVPLTEAIRTISFDAAAAELLGTAFPATLLKEYRTADGKGAPPAAFYKFDAMIAACAVRWKMDVLLTYDDKLQKLCKAVDQSWATAESYQAAQLTLVEQPKAADGMDEAAE